MVLAGAIPWLLQDGKMKWVGVGGLLWCNVENPGQSAATTRQGQGKRGMRAKQLFLPSQGGLGKGAPCMPRPVLPSSQAAGQLIRYPLRPYGRGRALLYFSLECEHLHASFFVHHLSMAQAIVLFPELMP
jgi:hypothetical protein